MLRLIIAFWVLAAMQVTADEPDIRTIIEVHVLPRFQALVDKTSKLEQIAADDCSPDSPALVDAYHNAFDAWVGVSHLRFGPSEKDDRAFALAFWPDPRGSTPKALAALFKDEDPAVTKPEKFATVSIAARGFYALEFLLFDPRFTKKESPDYHCALIRALTVDIYLNAAAILNDWEGNYADLMLSAGNSTYQTQDEATRQFFTALVTGLEFTSATRIGRPLGTFERPRPNRAEARRSERSVRHVSLSLASTRELASLVSGGNEQVDRAFDTASKRASGLDDPVFADVANPQGRLQVEVLQQSIDVIRRLLAEMVAPSLGITAGFNSLDGD